MGRRLRVHSARRKSVSWRPLNTLTGRLVLVTILAVAVSYAVAFAIFSNERGTALRRAAETVLIERVAYTAERLRATPAPQRAAVADTIRDFSIRYDVSHDPLVNTGVASGAGGRIARAISDRLNGADVRATAETVQRPSRRWGRSDSFQPTVTDDDIIREHRRRHGRGEDRHGDHGDGPLVHTTEVGVSVRLDSATWLNAQSRLPGPRPAPLSVLAGALVSVLAVGIGAALISRQIGRPLADLASAAQALGSGQSNVEAPVSGPDDVRRASTAFNAMAERLGRQLSRQRQMLWALSHDLRTPITALRLRAELIEDDTIRARLLGPLEEMERLTEQALSLARAGASDEQRARVDVAEIARTLCGELQEMGLNVVADAPAPVMAECRPSEIARVMRNLAENAVKYAGSGVMSVTRSENGETVIEVRDDGPGVPADQLARLATPFFRADDARSGEITGAGLGLAIAQAIADSHGAKLILANRTPRGFSARLVLPA